MGLGLVLGGFGRTNTVCGLVSCSARHQCLDSQCIFQISYFFFLYAPQFRFSRVNDEGTYADLQQLKQYSKQS